MKTVQRVPADAGVRSLALAPTTGATSTGPDASRVTCAGDPRRQTVAEPIGVVTLTGSRVGAEP